MWDERWNNIIKGEHDDTAHHSDEYLAWYRGITHLRIGRGMDNMEASKNAVDDQSVVKVKLILMEYSHLLNLDLIVLASCLCQVRTFVERAFGSFDENASPTTLSKVLKSVHSKHCKFHASCAAGFDKLDIEDCLKDETDGAQQVNFEI